jgi:hypothetical protein
MATALDFSPQRVTSVIDEETHAVAEADMAAAMETGHGTCRESWAAR